MNLRIHVEASAELESAAVWYDDQSAGLGDELLAEVDRALEAILAAPRVWPVVGGRMRRFLLSRFPYAVLFSVDDSHISVFAFAHHKRRPGYWSGRRFE